MRNCIVFSPRWCTVVLGIREPKTKNFGITEEDYALVLFKFVLILRLNYYFAFLSFFVLVLFIFVVGIINYLRVINIHVG